MEHDPKRTPELVDMFDDDCWFGRDGRLAKEVAERFDAGMGRLQQLSEQLKAEAYREYLAREAQRVESGSAADMT